MQLPGITYHSAGIEDWETFGSLPDDLKDFFREYNGIVAFEGGIQIWGCVKEPTWISLYEIWKGRFCLSKNYESVLLTDIPFAHDCCGDQFLLRNGRVCHLSSENGKLELLELTPFEFIQNTIINPDNFLSLVPLRKLYAQGKELSPGQLLSIYPPFSISANGDYLVKAIKVEEQLDFLAYFYSQIKNLPEGAQVELKVTR